MRPERRVSFEGGVRIRIRIGFFMRGREEQFGLGLQDV